jgi:hypothetical protein
MMIMQKILILIKLAFWLGSAFYGSFTRAVLHCVFAFQKEMDCKIARANEPLMVAFLLVNAWLDDCRKNFFPPKLMLRPTKLECLSYNF